MTINEVQIYGQYCWHDNAYIVGNRDGLVALRDAIDTALSDSGVGQAKTELFVSDGEGYDLFIINVASMDSLVLPYEADYAKGTSRTVTLRELLEQRRRQ